MGFCLRLDTDEHLLNCCGYMDIHQNKLDNRMFWLVDSDIEGLKVGAQILLKIHERLLVVNEDADISGES